jgi:hypothetical protein
MRSSRYDAKASAVTFEYCTVEDHSRETVMLEERF